MTAMQTAFAGSGDTTTSSTSALGSEARTARNALSLAFAEFSAMMRVTVSQPPTAIATRAVERNSNATATDAAAPNVNAAAAPVDTRSTRHASARPTSNRSDNSTRTTREPLTATSAGTETTQSQGSTMNTESP